MLLTKGSFYRLRIDFPELIAAFTLMDSTVVKDNQSVFILAVVTNDTSAKVNTKTFLPCSGV